MRLLMPQKGPPIERVRPPMKIAEAQFRYAASPARPAQPPAPATPNMPYSSHLRRFSRAMAASVIETCSAVVAWAQRWCRCIWSSDCSSQLVASAFSFSAAVLLSALSFL